MNWTYEQSTGLLRQDGVIIGAGYSGHNEGRMNFSMQNVRNIGPIPVGSYVIGPAQHHLRLGPLAIPLSAAPETNTYGRSAFFIHGDSSAHPGLASEGCIILAQIYRSELARAAGQILQVVI